MKKLLTVLFTLIFAAGVPLAEAAQHQKTKRPATHSVKLAKAPAAKTHSTKHSLAQGKKAKLNKKAVLAKKAPLPHKSIKAKKAVVKKHR